MPMDLTDGKSTLVQVIAWCRQATSHYLSQCWPRSLEPYGINRPQWVTELPLHYVGEQLSLNSTGWLLALWPWPLFAGLVTLTLAHCRCLARQVKACRSCSPTFKTLSCLLLGVSARNSRCPWLAICSGRVTHGAGLHISHWPMARGK